MKKCRECDELKPASDFAKKSTNRDGLSYVCKTCHSEYCKKRYADKKMIFRALRADYVKRIGPKKAQEHVRRCQLRVYGLSLEEYQNMVAERDGQCDICKHRPTEKEKSLAVDHDHTTGQIRGLLCNNCNRGLGWLKDDPEILVKALEYLQAFAKGGPNNAP